MDSTPDASALGLRERTSRKPRSSSSRKPRAATLLRESFVHLIPHGIQTQGKEASSFHSSKSIPWDERTSSSEKACKILRSDTNFDLNSYSSHRRTTDETAIANDTFREIEYTRSQGQSEMAGNCTDGKLSETYVIRSTGGVREGVEARDEYVNSRWKTHSIVKSQRHEENECGKNVHVSEVAGRPTKLKLKLGGVIHTLHTVLPLEKNLRNRFEGGEWPKKTSVLEARKRHHRRSVQGLFKDEETVSLLDKKRKKKHTKQKVSELRNLSLQPEVRNAGNIVSRSISQSEKTVSSKIINLNSYVSPSAQPLRKSSRVVKRRVFHREDDQSLDTERKSRRKVKQDEYQGYLDNEAEACLNRRSSNHEEVIRVSNVNEADRSWRMEPSSLDGANEKLEVSLTVRQRSLQLCKQGVSGISVTEYPEGLARSSSGITTDQKVKLSDDCQAKKVEAARRRKQRVEKAAKDIQASAIQKILGQDSVRKRKEDQLEKKREQAMQSKRAADVESASNSIRWIYGPTGTIVSWSKDVELPMLFNSGPPSYPPPREKCAVPTCNNAYKYRHSKLKLPLCSLQCYQMIET